MTQEEKAKAYDEAIDKAKKELDACGSQDCDAARQIFRLFPELTEESEDEKVRKEITQLIQGMHDADPRKERWLAWLEKQNLIMAKSPQLGEQKPAWSEKDSPYYDDICEILRNLILIETDKINKDFVQKDLDWLKSLKDRYSWKPSEKQMKALKEACDEHWEPDGLDPLYTLYQDLKKLREE